MADPFGDAARGAIVNSPDSGEYMTAYFENFAAENQIENEEDLFRYGNGALTGKPAILSIPTQEELDNMSDEQLVDRTKLLEAIEASAVVGSVILAGTIWVFTSPLGGAIVGIASAGVMNHLDNVTDAYQAACSGRGLC